MNNLKAKSGERRRVIATALCGIAFVVGGVAFRAQRANAYSTYGCNWGSGKTSLYFTNNFNSSPYTAGARWNSAAANLRFIAGGSDFVVEGQNAGNTGWAGLTHNAGTYTSWNPCSTGTVVTKNTYYAGYPNGDEDVLTHEFGHVAGLADINAVIPSCPGGGFTYYAVMHYSMEHVTGACPAINPTADDVSGVNSIY